MNWLLAIASAVLLVLIFPRFDITLLAPVALTPLLIALGRERRAHTHFFLGYSAGIVFWFGVCHWIQYVLANHGGLAEPMSWLALTLFCLAKAAHMGVFALLAGAVTPKPYALIAIPALWTGLERTHGPLGFAWMALGNAGIDMAIPMRLAPITGVYGLSFVFAALSTALALVALKRPRRELLPLAALLVLLVLPSIPAVPSPTHSAAAVQPNLNEEATYPGEAGAEMRSRLLTLSMRAALAPGEPKADLILWPEVPAPIYYEGDAVFRSQVNELARVTGSHFLFGTVTFTESGAPLNSAAMVDPQGKLIDRYDKIQLVPFGEFVPRFFGFVNKVSNEAGDFAPGARVVIFPANGEKAGAFICYESAFPDFVRQFAKAGAGVLVNLSNDGYFGNHAAREQHLLIARMRAAENRRWILRPTNNGITVSIDPTGRVRSVLPPYKEIAGRLPYGYEHSTTPYTLHGDWFAWGCLIVGVALTVLAQIPVYRRA